MMRNRFVLPLACMLLLLAACAPPKVEGLSPIVATLSYLSQLTSRNMTVVELMSGLYPIALNQGKSAQLLHFPRPDYFTPILWGNVPMSNALPVLGAIGTEPVSGTRVAFWTSDPFRTSRYNAAEQTAIQLVLRSISWALEDSPSDYNTTTASSTRTVTLSFMKNDNSTWFDVNSGVFKLYFPNWTVRDCSDEATFATCLAGADAHFFGGSTDTTDASAVQQAVAQRLAAGKPCIYIHDAGWGGDHAGASVAMGATPFPYAGTYFSPQSPTISSEADIRAYYATQSYPEITAALQRLQSGDWTFDISKCADDACTAEPLFASQIGNAAASIKAILASLETAGISPAGDPHAQLGSGLVTIGDYMRSGVTYPLTSANSSKLWAECIIADATYSPFRSYGYPPHDLGNFNFHLNSTVPRIATFTKTFQTRAYGGSISSTVSCAPGDDVIITRTDTNPVDYPIGVYVNMLRDNSHPIKNQAYVRPANLRGNVWPLKPNVPVHINSAYGGIIYISLATSSSGPQSISLTFENVVQHPVYDVETGDSDTLADYVAQVNAKVHGWSEIIVSPQLQIKLNADRAVASLNDAYYAGNHALQMQHFHELLYNYHYAMAGFTSNELAITPFPGVAAKAAEFGLRGMNATGPQHVLQGVQHMVSDYFALCGWGCSGNPIDFGWAASPYGWGDHHELGHNIQYGRFMMNGEDSGEVSNNLFPLSINYYRARVLGKTITPNTHTKTNGIDKMLAAIAAGQTPAQAGIVPSILDFYETLVLSGSDRWDDNGFQVIPMLYLMSRNIDAEQNWTTARDNYGLSLFDDRGSINGNDFMVMAFSWLNKLDYRSFFWSWGATWSAQANAQIDLYNFDRAPTTFIYPSGNLTNFENVTVNWPTDPYVRGAPVSAAALPLLSVLLVSLLLLATIASM